MFLLCTGVFVTLFGAAYFISARFCHRFVGYLEEEAVITYTHCIQVTQLFAIFTFSCPCFM